MFAVNLKHLVPEFCHVGYDIIVHVGINAYEKFRTAKEISTELQSKNVFYLIPKSIF